MREQTFGFNVVGEIDLPAQAGTLAYTFGYNGSSVYPYPNHTNGWGELSSITLPSGAQATYSYHYDGYDYINSFGAFLNVLHNHPRSKTLSYQREYDGASTSATETWEYKSPDTSFDCSAQRCAKVIKPDGGVVTDYVDITDFFWDQRLVYKTERPDGSVIERIWNRNRPFGSQAGAANPYVKTEFTSLRDSAGTLVKTAIKDFNYDKNGNLTQIAEYDWVNYGDVPRANGRPTGIPGTAALKRMTFNSSYSPTPDASNTTIDDPDSYHKPTSPRLRNAVESTEVRNEFAQALSRSEFTYDNATTTGNLIRQMSWDSTKGGITRPLTSFNSISASHQYDIYGNRTLTSDARGFQTQFVPDGNNLYISQTRAALGTTVQRTTSYDHDFYTGVVTSQTDVDNSVTARISYDVFARPTLVQEGYLTAIERRTATEYSDAARRVIVRQDLNTTGDGKLVSIQHYDQLGGTRLSRQLEDASTQNAYDETSGIKVQSRYQYSGTNSYTLVSNPYRAASSATADAESTMGWNRTKLDNGGRVVEVQTFSGAGLPSPWGANTSSTGAVTTLYDSNNATVTDQASKVRRSVTDGLGRLIRVDEPDTSGNPGSVTAPTQPTYYTYDAPGNLTLVQQGSQQRRFTYDSLSRLRSAKNPEQVNTSGKMVATSYGYDDNNNLQTKTDARGVVTSFAYDGLNRVTNRSYSGPAPGGTTPGVTYGYDNAAVPNSKGRPTSVSSSVSSYSYGSYDVIGRVLTGNQTTDGQNYSMSYQYNLAGSMTSETYPSGRVVATEYDSAGRMAGVKNQATGLYYTGATASDATNRLQYTAHGALSVMKLGNGKWEHTNYNSRLQPLQIGLGTSATNSSILQLDYGYGSTSNNGNVLNQTITIGATVMSQSYGYDSLNRLSSATETVNAVQQWQQTYDCDRYGDRAVRGGSYIPQPQLTPQSSSPTDFSAFNQSTNRIALGGFGYDTAGNLTSDPATAANAMLYDAENRQISYTKAGVTTTYSYDGDGRRVKKIDNTGTTVFVYNVGGQLIAEYTDAASSGGGGTSYLTQDHLGSTRVVTDANGNVKARHDYLPFGEEIPANIGGRSSIPGYTANDTTRQRFTSQERDAESGLDYFGARYYSGAQGRFTSVDPLLSSGRDTNPQSWNRYVYVFDNPMRWVDPSGLDAAAEEEQKRRAAQAAADFEAAKTVIDQIAKNGGNLVIYVAGIQNPNQQSTEGARQAAAEITDESVGNVVSVSNRSGIGDGRSSAPNEGTAQAVADIVKYALKSGLNAGQISIIAHSNGVPSLAQGLETVKNDLGGAVQFNAIKLYAPNTSDVSVIRSIGEFAKPGGLTLTDSTRDLGLFAADYFSSRDANRSPKEWKRVLQNVDVQVIQTRQFTHAFKAYAREELKGKVKPL